MNEIDNNGQFLDRVIFSDEPTFLVSGHFRRHNVRISIHVFTEEERERGVVGAG